MQRAARQVHGTMAHRQSAPYILPTTQAALSLPDRRDPDRSPQRVTRQPLHHRARDRARRHGDRVPRAATSSTTAKSRSRCSSPSSAPCSASSGFSAEIQVTANLQHPNLLPLFDSGRSRRAAVLRDAVRRRREPAPSASTARSSCRSTRRCASRSRSRARSTTRTSTA